MTKKLARLSTGWDIIAGEQENRFSQEMADFIRYVLWNIKTSVGPEIAKADNSSTSVTFPAGSFEDVLLNIMTALDFGFSLSEKVFSYYDSGPFSGKLGLAAIKTREPFGYDFKTDIHGNLISILGPYGADLYKQTQERRDEYPPSKFVIYSYSMEYANWYGQSDLRQAYRAFWSKDLVIKWMNIYLERYGMPTALMKYPAKGVINAQMESDMDDILKNLQAKAGVRLPDNFDMQFLEATRSGEAGYQKAIDEYNKAISRAILIPNKLGFGEDEGGSYALGKKHFDLFILTLKKLGKDIEETIVNEQIIKPLIMMNYGPVDEELMPYFQFESLEGEDTGAKANVIKTLVDGKIVDAREEWVREYLSLPKMDVALQAQIEAEKQAMLEAIARAKQEQEEAGKETEEEDDEKEAEDDKEDEKEESKESMAKRRSLSRFEKKVDFTATKQAMDDMEVAMVKDLQGPIEEVKKSLIKNSLKIFNSGNEREVNDLRVNGMGNFGKMLRNYLDKIHLDSKLIALEEMEKGGMKVEIKKKFASFFAKQVFEPWEPIDPAEAIKLFNSKVSAKVVTKDGEKVLVTLGKPSELKFYDSRAFYIKGVEEKYILDKAKATLLAGLKNGWSQRELTTDLNAIFDKYLPGTALTQPSRLETIVRTNLSEAYNIGRKSIYEDPTIKDQIPYVQYSAVMDSRTTEYCSAMDGKIFRNGEIEPPPAHFNALAEGTLIDTLKGHKKIEDVNIGDFVKTHRNRYKKVYSTMSKKGSKVRRINTDTGKVFLVTDEHPVLTKKGWRLAGDLNIGDILFENFKQESGPQEMLLPDPNDFPSLANEPFVPWDVVKFSDGTIVPFSVNLKNDHIAVEGKVYGWKPSTIIMIADEEYNKNVYNLAVEEDETYLAEGLIVHNCRSTLVGVIQQEAEMWGSDIEVYTQAEAEAEAGVERMEGFCRCDHSLLKPPMPNPFWFAEPVTKCLYSSCNSENVQLVVSEPNFKTYHCGVCGMDFKVSYTGDLFLQGPNKEWERVTQGYYPSYYDKEK
jgi:ribosomal protein L12E/L44/L45/RPP1/RPP2